VLTSVGCKVVEGVPLTKVARMARLPRLDFAGIAQHVVQRGNDCQPCFVADDDYAHYRQELEEAARRSAAHCMPMY
jgi:hypothetical protein